MVEYTESVSGFKIEGDWSDVVEHGERVAYALKELDVEDEYETQYDQYNEWRPKASERIDTEVNEKTARQASTEDKSEDPSENVEQAGDKLVQSSRRLNRPRKMLSHIGSSLKYMSKAAYDWSRIAFRNIEELVYKDVMTKMSPYYFDNELVSANMKEKSGDKFVLEININDDKMKHMVSKKLSDYNDEYERWHISSEFDIEQSKSVHTGDEGTDIDEEDGEEEATPDPTAT